MSTFFVDGPSSFAVRGRSYESEAPGQATRQARRARRWPVAAAVLLLLALAAWQLGSAAWIHARAALDRHLIASAWEGTKAGGAKRPWPWADSPQLTLISCRTFDATQPGTTRDYVVIADLLA